MREILIKLRELLTPAEVWVQGDFARTPDDIITTGHDPRATCFCILGGLQRLTASQGIYEVARNFLMNIAGRFVSEFNDDPKTTHEDVLALIDRAIAAA